MNYSVITVFAGTFLCASAVNILAQGVPSSGVLSLQRIGGGGGAPTPSISSFEVVHPDIEANMPRVPPATAKNYAQSYREAVSSVDSHTGLSAMRKWMAECIRYVQDPAKANIELNMAIYLLDEQNARAEKPDAARSMWLSHIGEARSRIQFTGARRIDDDGVHQKIIALKQAALEIEESAKKTTR
jgi:hypothetical protein